jgi:uncharacterized protein involved in exopolysaccharide biosynthesis
MSMHPSRPLPGPPDEREALVRGLDLEGLFLALWRARIAILRNMLMAGILAYAATFLIPKVYQASATILPPEESDLLSNMSLAYRALTKFPTFGVLSEYFTPADIYKAVLQSRTVGDEIVKQFDLQKVYRQKSLEKAIKKLHGRTKVKLNADGTIQVSVNDADAKRAAAIANAYLAALDRYNVEKRNGEARRTRMFLERRLAETDSSLRVSEALLREYQQRHHTVAPTSIEGAGSMQSAADLMARKIMLEVRLGVLRSYLRDDNDQVIQVRNELDQLNQRIDTLPAVQSDLQRMIRDQKVLEQLFVLLTAELEQARIREQQDTPTVQVLDAGVPPERHVWPRRTLTGAAAAVLALLGTAVVVARRSGEDVPAP